MRLMGGGQNRTHRAAVDEDGSLLLALEPGDERLPWLEGEEDDEPELDHGRILAVAVTLLLVLLVLVGVAWWLWAGRGEAELAPDGSLIEAAEGPYKVRPSNAGGREVLGTGDLSFARGEGVQVEGRIAARPAPAASAAAPAADTTAPAAQIAGVGVQIGAYPTREAAQAGWQQLNQRLEALRGRGHRILEGPGDAGTIYRLQVVAESVEAASQLCMTLREEGGDCQVKR